MSVEVLGLLSESIDLSADSLETSDLFDLSDFLDLSESDLRDSFDRLKRLDLLAGMMVCK